jgi:hypothetical protein
MENFAKPMEKRLAAGMVMSHLHVGSFGCCAKKLKNNCVYLNKTTVPFFTIFSPNTVTASTYQT